MPICVDRERRPNAGSRMAKLLNEEEEDEFYTNVYGGFTEEADDVDYQSESSVEDSIDSDFDDSSNPESSSSASDDDVDVSRKKRRADGVVTKAYKEPKRQKKDEESSSAEPTVKAAAVSKPQEKTAPVSTDQLVSEPRVLRHRHRPTDVDTVKTTPGKNASAKRKALLAEIAQRKNVPEVRRLTQEELLAEAKLTEEVNRRSLARYQRMEIEKKKARFTKNKQSGPMIRFHSFSVPVIETEPDVYGVVVDRSSSTVHAGPIVNESTARCTRNLITFADTECLERFLPKSSTPLPTPTDPTPRPPHAPRRRLQLCPITGLPAKYFDPVTLTPYANLSAFRVLRRLYQIHLETNTPPIELLREFRSGQ